MKCNFTSTLLLCTLFPSWLQGQEKPNIVYIMADDLGYGDLSCYGAKLISTPNIDKLAAQGRSFTDAHSVSSVSTPSRYAFLTGSYPYRYNNGEGCWRPLRINHPLLISENQKTLAEKLKENGYSTACIGKWHLGFQRRDTTDWNKPLRPGPIDVGFDYYFGLPLVSSGPPFVYVENDTVYGYEKNDPLIYNGYPISETQKYEAKGINRFSGGKKAHSLYKDDEVAVEFVTRSKNWIKDNKEKPFFLLLATTHIHHPFTSGKKFRGSSKCGLYGDYVQEFDWMVGEIMRTLKEENLEKNTLLIVTSDNGGMLNLSAQRAWRTGHRINGDLFGFKFGIWEGGHRIPFIVRWPEKIEANSYSNQLISNVDMFATFVALAGGKLNNEEAPDSYNVLEAFIGNPKIPLRNHLILAPNKSSHLSYRKGDWIFIPAQGGGGWNNDKGNAMGGVLSTKFTNKFNSDIYNGKIKSNAPKCQLFNLKEDICQKVNLADNESALLQEMRNEFLEKKKLKKTRE